MDAVLLRHGRRVFGRLFGGRSLASRGRFQVGVCAALGSGQFQAAINCNRYIRRLTMPFTLLTAEHGSTTRARAAFHALRQDKKIQVVWGPAIFTDGNARLFAR